MCTREKEQENDTELQGKVLHRETSDAMFVCNRERYVFGRVSFSLRSSPAESVAIRHGNVITPTGLPALIWLLGTVSLEC